MTMDPKQIAKQMIQFNKTAFDNTFNSLIVMHEQTEKMLGIYLEQAPMIPAEGKKAIAHWMKAYKKGCEEFKAGVEGNYKKVEDFFAACDKEGKTETVKESEAVEVRSAKKSIKESDAVKALPVKKVKRTAIKKPRA